MDKQKNGELSRMFGYAGKFHVLTVLGCVLSGISTILSMLPFVCIWLVIRDLIQAFAAGDISLATGSAHYAWTVSYTHLDIGATYPFSDPVALVCNDEGKLIGLDLNRGLRDETGEIYDIMAGTFLVVGLDGEDFASLSPELAQNCLLYTSRCV